MRFITLFLESVGGRWFFLPATITGLAGLVALLQAQGVTGIPEISWWALAFFALAPLTAWSVVGLLKKVVSLEAEISGLTSRLDQRAKRALAATTIQGVIEDFIVFKNQLHDLVDVSEIEETAEHFGKNKLEIFNKLSGVISAPEIYAMSVCPPTAFGYNGNPKRSKMMTNLDAYIRNAQSTLIRYVD